MACAGFTGTWPFNLKPRPGPGVTASLGRRLRNCRQNSWWGKRAGKPACSTAKCPFSTRRHALALAVRCSLRTGNSRY
eukprot:2454303-Rhodomonas_salina.4